MLMNRFRSQFLILCFSASRCFLQNQSPSFLLLKSQSMQDFWFWQQNIQIFFYSSLNLQLLMKKKTWEYTIPLSTEKRTVEKKIKRQNLKSKMVRGVNEELKESNIINQNENPKSKEKNPIVKKYFFLVRFLSGTCLSCESDKLFQTFSVNKRRKCEVWEPRSLKNSTAMTF